MFYTSGLSRDSLTVIDRVIVEPFSTEGTFVIYPQPYPENTQK